MHRHLADTDIQLLALLATSSFSKNCLMASVLLCFPSSVPSCFQVVLINPLSQPFFITYMIRHCHVWHSFYHAIASFSVVLFSGHIYHMLYFFSNLSSFCSLFSEVCFDCSLSPLFGSLFSLSIWQMNSKLYCRISSCA